MTTAAVLGMGSTLKMGDGGSPEVFTTIPEVLKFTTPDEQQDFVDVTNMDSSGNAREKIPGLVDNGKITVEANRVNTAAQNAVRTARTARTLKNFTITLPTSPTETASFAAYVRSWNVDTMPDKQLVLKFDLEISGPVTWA